MNLAEYKVTSLVQIVQTIFSGLIITGVAWILLEVHEGRERWARVEERLNTQSIHILELRNDLNLWNNRREAQEDRLAKLETRVSVLEAYTPRPPFLHENK